MKKKLCEPLCVLLSAVLLIGLLNVPAGAASILASGGCGASGNNVTWTLDREGALVISGTGAMYDYASKEDVPWYVYREQVFAVNMESGVTTVGQNAFRDCAKLETVTLPASGLTAIKNVAFYNCSALKTITIPAGVETIGESAFGFCALETVFIPASVSSIGESVFYRCSALTAIQVDAENAHYSSLEGILFNKIETETNTGSQESQEGQEGQEGQGNPGQTQTTVSRTLLIWYPMGKAEEEYTVPDGVKTIGSSAFHSASKLKKVTLSAGLEVIEPYAFAYSALGEISVPASLTTIGEYAFYECRGLSTTGEDGTIQSVGTVNFAGSRQQWNALKVGDKNNCLTNATIVFGDMKQDDVIASGECGALGSNATWSLSDKGDFLISGTGAMINYKSAAGVPWASYLASGSEEARDLRPEIKTLTVEGDIVENGVITKAGISNVGDYAFYDCVNLTTVTLPSTIQTIGAQAFSDCAALTAVNLSATKTTVIGDYAFNGSDALKSITLPETLKTIGKRAFLRSGLTAVTIPAGVTSIGEWAFRWCGSLTSFTMAPIAANTTPHQSASIGDYALANCAELERVSFTENLSSLGEYALANCVKLLGVSDTTLPTGVWIPASVFNIGTCAFHGCAALTAVNVDDANLVYCSASGMLMNKDKTCIYYYPAGRDGSCEIPESLESVVAFAFDGATRLVDVYYQGTEGQWNALVQGNRIGAYNDPLLSATFTYEGIDPSDDENRTTIVSSGFTTEGGRKFEITIHCGLNTAGAQVLCALYDTDGRFLRMQEPEEAKKSAETEEPTDEDESPDFPGLNPGEDTALTYLLDDDITQTGQVRLMILDGENLPCKGIGAIVPVFSTPEAEE